MAYASGPGMRVVDKVGDQSATEFLNDETRCPISKGSDKEADEFLKNGYSVFIR